MRKNNKNIFYCVLAVFLIAFIQGVSMTGVFAQSSLISSSTSITNIEVVQLDTLMITFDKPIDKETAQDPNKYEVSLKMGKAVSAELSEDGKTVYLKFSRSFAHNKVYSIYISGILDSQKNAVIKKSFVSNTLNIKTIEGSKVLSIKQLDSVTYQVVYDSPVEKEDAELCLNYSAVDYKTACKWAYAAKLGEDRKTVTVNMPLLSDGVTYSFNIKNYGIKNGKSDFGSYSIKFVYSKSKDLSSEGLQAYYSSMRDQLIEKIQIFGQKLKNDNGSKGYKFIEKELDLTRQQLIELCMTCYTEAEISKINESKKYIIDTSIKPLSFENIVFIGRSIKFKATPVIKSNTIMVPLSDICEGFTISSSYNEKTKTYILNKESINVELPVGSTMIKVNGKVAFLDVPSQMIGDMGYIPLLSLLDKFEFEKAVEEYNGLIIIK